jgi:hypothetical protein
MDAPAGGSIDVFGGDLGPFLAYVHQLVNSQHKIVRRKVHDMMKKQQLFYSLNNFVKENLNYVMKDNKNK